jgi:hypothetical protein
MDYTAESLKQAYPEIIPAMEKAAFDKGFAEGLAKGTDDGLKAGSEKERSRIKAVEDSSLPGHEALIASMKYDGITTAETAAIKILRAEKTLRETKLEAYKEDSPKPVATVDAAASEAKREDKPKAGELPTDEQMKAAWDKDKALRAEYGNDFAAYKAFTEEDAAGHVKIFGDKEGGK